MSKNAYTYLLNYFCMQHIKDRFIFPLSLPKYIFLFLGLFCFLFQSKGQDNGDGIEDKVVIIEKEAKLELPIANRNFQKIIFEAPKVKARPQQYEFRDVALDLPKLAAKIKVPTIPPDPIAKLYGNYVKVGFGNYTTPYLEGFFNSKRSDQMNYGLHIKHLSSQNGSVKSDKFSGLSATSINEIGGTLKYFAGKTILDAGVDFSYRGFNYYGFNPTIFNQTGFNESLMRDTIKQAYHTLGLKIGIENKDKKEPLNYRIGIQFFNFGDRFKASENEILLNWKGQYSLDEDKAISLSGLLSFSKRKDATDISRSFFIIKPAYHFTYENFRLRAGINIAYTSDTIKAYDKLHFYPSIHAEYQVIEKLLTAYGGIDGEMEKNTLRTFVDQNPYLASNQLLYHTNKALDLYVGAKGNLAEKINYIARFGLTNYKNLYFFNNSVQDSSKFSIFYAQGNSSVVNFTADISYETSEEFRIGVMSKFYGYSVSPDSIHPWHRPSILSSVYTNYNLYNKIYFNLDFYYIGGLKGRNFESGSKTDAKLPAVIDLNFKIDYKVSPVFSAFVELNNLLSKKYQLYQYYPVKGLNVLAGITYSF